VEKAAHAFVVMPFDGRLRPVFDGPVKRACRALKLSVERADDIFSTQELLAGIWTAIVNSLVVIADCTDRNANVFYELGIAHTLGKPVVLITQSERDVPTDITHVRYIKYTLNRVGLGRLEGALKQTLKETIASVWPARQALQSRKPRSATRRPPAG
jgi:hypothetical protein